MPQVFVFHLPSSAPVDTDALATFASLSAPRHGPPTCRLTLWIWILRGEEDVFLSRLTVCIRLPTCRWTAALGLLELPENSVGHLEHITPDLPPVSVCPSCCPP